MPEQQKQEVDPFLSRTFDEPEDYFSNPFSGDEKLKCDFSILAVERTNPDGSIYYEDVEHARIFISKDEIVVQPVDATHMRRWPRQYSSWKRTGSNEPGRGGTTIDKLIGASPAQIAELKHRHITSIELLAEAPEQMLTGMMGPQRLKQLAQAHLAIQRQEAPLAAMRAVDERLAKIDAVLEENARMRAELERRDAMKKRFGPKAKRSGPKVKRSAANAERSEENEERSEP